MRPTRVAIGLSVVAAGVVALTIALVATESASPRRASGPFAWLRPASSPMGWNVARTPNGAGLAYPPRWTPIKTDPGTASVALLSSGGRIVDYLNVTPKQGAETLANWSRFRLEKNRAEGDRDVRLLAAASNVNFRSARGSCVIDVYATPLTAYEEIACLVAGHRSSDVVVAAAPTRLWNEQVATLERAVSSFDT
jgi:hypothetical protein